MDKRPIVSVEGASPRTTLLIERREDKTMTTICLLITLSPFLIPDTWLTNLTISFTYSTIWFIATVLLLAKVLIKRFL